MVSRKYAGALALSALLGCSTQPSLSQPLTSRSDPNYLVSPAASLEEEAAMNYAISSRTGQDRIVDPFRGKRVSLMYESRSGPSGGMVPVDLELLNGVRRELDIRGAYTQIHGSFEGSYSNDIAISRGPKMTPADLVVIVDLTPGQIKGLDNVYTVRKDGNEYKFTETKR